MHRATIFLCALAGGAALTALAIDAPAQPQRGGPGGRVQGCTVYQHANYEGPRQFAGDGESPAFVGPVWNDQISSLRCDPRCAFEAFEDAGHRGRSQLFRDEVPFVGPAWNDRISAWRVSCAPVGGRFGGRGRAPACTFYEHANYAGRREEAGEGDEPFVGAAWNDQISSLQCRPGCTVTVFVDANHAGPSQRFAGDVGFVGPFWNDKISAYRISCRR